MCQFLFFMLPLTKQHIVPCLQTGDYSRRGQQGASNHWATKVAGTRQRVNQKIQNDLLAFWSNPEHIKSFHSAYVRQPLLCQYHCHK